MVTLKCEQIDGFKQSVWLASLDLSFIKLGTSYLWLAVTWKLLFKDQGPSFILKDN